MTISMKKQYTTRDGRPVRLLCVDALGDYPVVGLEMGGWVRKWQSDGRACGGASENDLIEAKPRVQCEWWVYRMQDGGHDWQLAAYSPETAKQYGVTLVARIPIDVEEGHGLEGGE